MEIVSNFTSNVKQPTSVDSFAQMDALADRLHRGSRWRFAWTPNTGEYYTDKNGNQVESKKTYWMPVGKSLSMVVRQLAGKNAYFGVNPTAAQGKPWERSKNATVSAVNCFFAEFDGKDEVLEAEWLPHYVAPDLAGLSKAKARGALQKAQTAAIDAAYKLNPEEYKRRAYERLCAAPVKPSAAWDSGGGYQAVWIFTETQHVNDDNRAMLAHYQREWVHRVGGDPSAIDLCRVLRFVGSENCKPKYAPNFPRVTFLWCDLDLSYDFDQLIALLPPPTEKTKTPRRNVHVPAGAAVDLGDFGDVPDLPHHWAIVEFNERTDIREYMLSLGYTDHSPGRGNRPGADSGGVEWRSDNSAVIYSSGDPLFCGHPIRPAHVLCVYEFNGDVDAMLAHLGAEVNAVIEACRQWVRRTDFADVVPLELQAVNGYRTNETDKAIALACLAEFQRYGKLTGPIGARQLSELTGRGVMTCARALKRIAGIIEPVNADKREPDQAQVYRLCDQLRRWDTSRVVQGNCEPRIMYATLPMDSHRAHDAFVRSMRTLGADELAERIQARIDAGKPGKATGDERRRLRATLPSAGPAALVVADALEEFGPLTQKDLCNATSKKKYSICRAVGRLVELELAEVIDGCVSLVPGWADRLNEITPQMPTAGVGLKRTIARLDATIERCEEDLKTAGADTSKWLHRRLERARKRKTEIAQAEGFESKASKRAAAAGNHSLTYWQLKQIRDLDEKRSTARMDLAEAKRRAQWDLTAQIRQWRSEGIGKKQAFDWLTLAEYPPREAWTAINAAWSVPAYTYAETEAA